MRASCVVESVLLCDYEFVIIASCLMNGFVQKRNYRANSNCGPDWAKCIANILPAQRQAQAEAEGREGGASSSSAPPPPSQGGERVGVGRRRGAEEGGDGVGVGHQRQQGPLLRLLAGLQRVHEPLPPALRLRPPPRGLPRVPPPLQGVPAQEQDLQGGATSDQSRRSQGQGGS